MGPKSRGNYPVKSCLKFDCADEQTAAAPVESPSTGWKPSYDDLFKFWESSLNLFVEGVEFMTKEQIYHAIKADCMKVSNDKSELTVRETQF